MPRPLPLLVVGALLSGGCAGDDTGTGTAAGPEPSDPSIPVDGDTLVVAIPYDPGTLDALRPTLALSATIAEITQPGLVRRHLLRGEVKFEPMLAETFQASGTEATYTLREGLVWQDGTPVTASDAAFTWSRLSDPKGDSPYRGDVRLVSKVEARDDRTVAVTFAKSARPELLHGFGTRALVSAASPDATPPLASGSYRVERWDPDDLLVLAANPTAPAALRPRLDRIVFDVNPSYEARLDDLIRGRVDLVTGIAVSDVPRIQREEGLELIRRPSASLAYVGYDLDDPRFSDLRVRQALTMAVDRERMIRDLFTKDGQSYGSYAIGTVSPALEGWFSREVLPLPFDAVGAPDLLTRAGWIDSDKDGSRDRRGQELDFTLLVQDGSPTIDKMTDLLVAWWGSVGAKVTVERVAPAVLAERVAADDFDAFLWGYPADPRVDLAATWRTKAPQNWVGYSSKPVDKLLDELTVTTDTVEAQHLAHEIQRLVHADQPFTFLAWQDDLAVVHDRFRGINADLFSLFHGIEQWYVPRAEQRWTTTPPDPRLPPPAPRPGQ